MGGGLKKPGEQPAYLSYLLRLWQVDTEGVGQVSATVWRASLESSLTGKRQGFADLDELFEFLQRQTGAVADVNEEQERRKGNACQESSGHRDG
jgi:hypothetical protein